MIGPSSGVPGEMLKSKRRLVVMAATLLLWAGAAPAASFDCKTATSRVEHMICDDPELNTLDAQLQGAYLGALDRANRPADVTGKQRAWLAQRDACGEVKCMSAAYGRQIALLSKLSDEPAICGGGGSTPEVNACAAEYSRRADRQLARYVAAARRRLIDESKDESSRPTATKALAGLDASQAAWVAYRKAECGAVYDWWSQGTIRGAMYEGCWQSITLSRTKDVWATWLTFMDDTPALMPKPVGK